MPPLVSQCITVAVAIGLLSTDLTAYQDSKCWSQCVAMTMPYGTSRLHTSIRCLLNPPWCPDKPTFHSGVGVEAGLLLAGDGMLIYFNTCGYIRGWPPICQCACFLLARISCLVIKLHVCPALICERSRPTPTLSVVFKYYCNNSVEGSRWDWQSLPPCPCNWSIESTINHSKLTTCEVGH